MEQAAPAVRTPPELILFPEVKQVNERVAKVFLWLGLAMLAIGVILIILIPNTFARFLAGGIVGGEGLIFAIIGACMFPVMRRRRVEYEKAFSDLAQRHPLGDSCSELGRLLLGPKRFRLKRELADANRKLDPGNPPRAHIACVGPTNTIAPGPYQFEPEVITPTRYFGRQWILIAISAVVILAALLRLSGTVSWLNKIPIGVLGSFGYFYVAILVFGGIWLWRSMIRPTYIRIAPGIIQVLRFPFRGGKPDIRSFPMEAGTLVVAYTMSQFNKRRTPAMLLLVRGEHVETINMWFLKPSEEMLERLWQAIFSTSPIPPLSEETLVG